MSSTGPGKEGANEDRFAYKTMASIVHRQDRRNVTKDEPTGESQRVTSSEMRLEMGAAVAKTAKTTTTTTTTTLTEVSKKKRKQNLPIPAVPTSTGDSAYEELLRVGGSYEPTTKLTEKAWEDFLSLLHSLMPSVERDVLRSAAEESLQILKSADQWNAQDRKIHLEKLLDMKSLPDETFRALQTCGDQVTDFVAQTDEGVGMQTRRKKDSEIAIVFEDESDNGEEDGEAIEAEVVSSESEEEEESKPLPSFDPDRRRLDGAEEMDVDPITIDGFWLQRELALHMVGEEASDVQELAEKVLELFSHADVSLVENHLVSLLGFDRLDLVKKLLKNRLAIFYCIRLHRAQSEEAKQAIREEMHLKAKGVLDRLLGAGREKQQTLPSFVLPVAKEEVASIGTRMVPSGRTIDLLTLSRLNPIQRNGEVVLPKGSWRRTMKAFEEVHVQPLKPRDASLDPPTVKIKSLPSWMQFPFTGMEELNRVQSKVFPAIADAERFNMLVSAPTSSGKTNIALLAILHEMSMFVNAQGQLDVGAVKESMKVVYVAPMKALVQEVVANFSSRLPMLTVKELSGDSQLTRMQIQDTQILVTTPEKWDVITRKAGERSFLSLVKLMILDEIHLLNDTRGAVLEALIARTMYLNDAKSSQAGTCRILGISATLPNYLDVATFLRVPLDRGLFYFDNSYRPVPLHQVFVGVTDQKALSRAKQMDQICFEKVCAATKNQHQVLVFVHSRKDTFRTCKLMQTKAEEEDKIDLFLPQGLASREILVRSAESVKNVELKSLLVYGLAIHHAGMSKSDRTLVEDLFAGGHIRVMMCTATLAWGVNLPAHTVIIRGTQVYNPEMGCWAELPQLDLLQMIGRSGRPQFDTEGEGIVITTFKEMQYYLSLCNNQLQIESSLLKRLPEHVNAEVVIGNISSLEDCVRWLEYTFLFVRAKLVPSRYGVLADDFSQWQVDVCHAALLSLERTALVHYDKRTFAVHTTALGRIASHYYLSPDTVSNFVKVLDPHASVMDLVRVLTVADEFKQITIRLEEKSEVAKLVDRVPIPIKEGLDDPSTKVNVLLQAFISGLSLEGHALRCDLVYIHQSASRLARALFEICMTKQWANAMLESLQLCLCLDRKCWASQSPLRQLPQNEVISEDVLKQLERKTISFTRLLELSVAELGALIKQGNRQVGQALHQRLHRFPKVDVSARMQTLSRTSMRMELALNCDFEFVEDLLGPSLLFWILVMDGDGKQVYHAEPFVLKARFALEEHLVSIVLIDLPDPLPPYVLVKLASDSYLHCLTTLAVPWHALVLPKKSAPFSELLDLSPIQVKQLPLEKQHICFSRQGIETFWPAQTQCYSLMESDDNVLVSIPIGKTLLAELALIRSLENDPNSRIVYVHAHPDEVEVKFFQFQERFPGMKIAKLRGVDANEDLKLLEQATLVVTTSRIYEILSRRWKQKSRKVLHELSLVIFDDMHMGDVDMELCVSRLRYMCVHLKRKIRLVGLSGPILNAEDLAAWMGQAKVVSLAPNARHVPTEVSLESFNEHHFETRQGLMIRPAFRLAFDRHTKGTTFVFLPSKRHVRLCLIDFIQLLQVEEETLQGSASSFPISDAMLRTAWPHRMSVFHEGMTLQDRNLVVQQPQHVVLISVKALHKMPDSFRCTHSVLLGTSWFQNRRYEEYSLPMVEKMLNKASVGASCRQTVFCYLPQKSGLKKFLTQSRILESQLHEYASDILLNELCTTKTIELKQDALDFFTWTFFYRCLLRNPSYYYHSSSLSGGTSAYLSEIVDQAVETCKDSGCLLEEEENKLVPTSLGMIAAFHDVKASTMELFSSHQKEEYKPSKVFDLISSASEFLPISLGPKEEVVLEALARNSLCVSLPLVDPGNFTEVHIKVNILLQAWCNNKLRLLTLEQRDEVLHDILPKVPKLLHALVDLASSNGWLKPCLVCLEACQTMVQQVWATESVLKQFPYFSELSLGPLVRNVYDVINMEPEDQAKLFEGLSPEKVNEIANFCNAYPSITVQHQILVGGQETKQVKVEETITILVSFQQDEEDEDWVVSQRFPEAKRNLWWAILGEEKGEGVLLAIKRVNNKQAVLTCEFATVGKKQLKLYVVCDSYLGCDQTFDVEVDVVEE